MTQKIPHKLFSQHRFCAIGFIAMVVKDSKNKKFHHTFWAKDTSKGLFVGLDNRTGNAWIEEFVDPEKLLDWFEK